MWHVLAMDIRRYTSINVNTVASKNMVYNGKHFYTSSSFIKWCAEQGMNEVEVAHLLREYWYMKNIEIGTQLDLYYKPKGENKDA